MAKKKNLNNLGSVDQGERGPMEIIGTIDRAGKLKP